MLDLVKVLAEASEEEAGKEVLTFTTADIVILVIIGLIIVALIVYFTFRKAKGKKLTDCDCGTTSGKSLVKEYNKKYKKENKEETACSCGCSDHKEETK